MRYASYTMGLFIKGEEMSMHIEMSRCGNEVYKRIDYALVQCTRCGGLWDALMYPGFPVPNVEWGVIWDTSKPVDDDMIDGEDDPDDDSGDEQMEDGEDDDFDN